MSNTKNGCEVAHLCPQIETDWFKSNGMFRYVSQTTRQGSRTINDPANCLLLRADLHRGFDKLDFVFVPKDDDVLATHVVERNPEFQVLYHNARLHQTGAAPEFLFARFAYTIFPSLACFLQLGQPRHLNFALKQEQRLVDAAECEEIGSRTFSRLQVADRSNTSSPTKRPREDTYADVEDEDELEEDAPGGTKRKKTQHFRSDDGLTSTLNQAVDLPTLVEQRLQFERARSDPGGTWQKELDWYESIVDGGVLFASDLPRYGEFIGGDRISGDDES